MSTPAAKYPASDAARRFGYAVVLRRTMLEMKRRDLAERAELSYPYVSEIEKGTKEPSAKSLRQLAEALGFNSTAELLAWTEQQQPPSGHEPSLESAPSEAEPVMLATGRPEPRWPRSTGSSPARGWQVNQVSLRDVGGSDLSPSAERAVAALVDRVMGRIHDELHTEIARIVSAEVARQLEQERLRR